MSNQYSPIADSSLFSKCNLKTTLSADEIKEMRTFYQKEKAEKNDPFSVIALGILDDEEQGYVDDMAQEEIDAMRSFYKDDKTPFGKIALEILDDIEKAAKETKQI